MKRIVRRIASPAAAIAAVAAAGGCTQPFRSNAADTDPVSWKDPAGIVLANADTTSLRDLTLFLRCNDRFAEDTLTVRIRVRTPDSLQHEEPLRFEEFFRITSPRTNGPAAIAREIAVPYRRRVRFAREGDYRMTIAPTRPVRGIEAVGIGTSDSQ